MVWSLLVLAIAPSIALFLFFYARDRYEKEPVYPLLLTFLLGAGAMLCSLPTSRFLQALLHWSPETQSLIWAFTGAVLVVGLSEEGWKFVVVRFYSYRQPEFDEPYDGIMYSVMTALGFATLENVLYVLAGGIRAGILRGLLAVPGHAFYGVLVGYFLGEAKFSPSSGRATLLALFGLGLAVLAHGLYDFMVFALDKRPLLLLVLPVFALLGWAVVFKATRRQAEQSPYGRPGLGGK